MKKTLSYEVLAPLLSAQLRRGVVTNCFLAAEDYRRAIAAGALSHGAWGGGLLLLLQRKAHTKALWFLTDMTQSLPFALPENTVMEFAERPNTASSPALDFWVQAGFLPTLHRLRLQRPAGAALAAAGQTPAAPQSLGSSAYSAALTHPVRTCTEADFFAVRDLLAQNFHPLYGCLPTTDELLRDLRAGAITSCSDAGGGPRGLLHVFASKNSFEVRHLATAANARGRGVASALLAAQFASALGQKSLVWTGVDNAAALRLYARHAYAPDGWTSTVLSNERPPSF